MLLSRNLILRIALWMLGVGATLAGTRADQSSAWQAADLEFFESKIRPILVEKCFRCHGPEVVEPKGKLRLHSREHLVTGGESGPAVIPNNPDESLMIQAVRYEGLEMPPDSKLSLEEIGLLVSWVKLGLPWSSTDTASNSIEPAANPFDLEARKTAHWCWQPAGKQTAPTIAGDHWCTNDIDRFILQKLKEAQIRPSPDATPEEWLRRVTFDLTGLPPTAEEIQDFLEDRRLNRKVIVVDKLLSSPRFGIQWARHWLDLVRYAETCGHEFDYPIPYATRYRDYVIRAFNDDVPYDQFVREHIAGDLLPDPRKNINQGWNESILGTGFWYLGEATHGPVDLRANEAGLLDNRIDVFGKTFLGLTLACARCHDHKFDAISTADYYALTGIMKSTRRVEGMLDPMGQIEEAQHQIEKLLASAPPPPWKPSETTAKYLLVASKLLMETPVQVDTAAIEHGLNIDLLKRWMEALQDPQLRQPDHPMYGWHSIVLNDDSLERRRHNLRDAFELHEAARQASVSGTRWQFGTNKGEGWGEWSTTGAAFGHSPANGLSVANWQRYPDIKPVADSGRFGQEFQGLLRSPEFTLDRPFIHVRARGSGGTLRIIIAGYDMNRYNAVLFEGLIKTIENDQEFAWVTLNKDLGRYRGERAYLEFEDASGTNSICIQEIVRSDEEAPPAWTSPLGLADDPQLSLDNESQTLESTLARNLFQNPDPALVQWMAKKQLGPDEATAAEQLEWTRSIDERIQKAAKIARTVPPPVRCQSAADGDMIPGRVYIRGNAHALGQEIPHRDLEAFGGHRLEGKSSSGRLELAEAITSLDHPLVSRVIVNRIWHHLFGQGIVASTDNFGVMGETPTHPELLDYLAQEFIAAGWSTKSLVRRIVLSRTYGQSSRLVSDELAGGDPQNRLYHRARLRRLTGEQLRDSVLFISGKLDEGFPESSIPVHLTPFMSGRGRPAASGPVDGEGHRSIFLEIRRNFLSPWMMSLDTPIPFSTVGRRNISNVPAQALLLMNDPFVWEQCDLWARRTCVEWEAMPTKAKWNDIFMSFYGRQASSDDVQAMESFACNQDKAYQSAGVTANAERKQFVWRDVCHALINCKEFAFVR